VSSAWGLLKCSTKFRQSWYFSSLPQQPLHYFI